MMELYINGLNFGKCNGYRQYSEPDENGKITRKGWAFSLENHEKELKICFEMIKKFTSGERLEIMTEPNPGRKDEPKKMENWKVFRINGKEKCAYTIRGTFDGEEEATKELLAAENGCAVEDIAVSIERR